MSVEVTLWVGGEGGNQVAVGPAGWTEFSLGRGEDVGLFLNHPTVSRRHCRLLRRGSQVLVEDLGSRLGTFVGPRRVEGQVLLATGDRLRVGELDLLVRIVDAEAEARARAMAIDTVAPAPQPASTPAPSSPVRPPPPPRAPEADTTMAAKGGEVATGSVRVDLAGRSRVVLGRDPASDVALRHPVVSKAHAEVVAEGEGFAVRDLGSRNGTFVGGERVTKPRRLAVGDVVTVGPFALRFDGRRLVSGPPRTGTRIEVRGLGKQVADRATGRPLHLLKDVGLTILPKEFVGLLGASGCGKSTFMDTVNGRRPATEGQVLYDGENLYNHFDRFKRGIGYVPQELIFHDALPVADVLRYASRLRLPDDTGDDEIERNIDRVLGVVGLTAQRETLVKHLSGGQKKRVSIAMELLSEPTVLFLDEATSGLDLGTEAQMMRLFRELADGGVTTLCITHYVDSLDVCDMVAYFVKGRLAFFGPPKELKAYFGVSAIREVYLKEQEQTPEAWEAAFRESKAYRKYVAERASPPAPQDATRVRPGHAIEAERPRDLKRQAAVLTSRYVQLIRGERKALWISLALGPVIGLLVALVLSGKAGETGVELARRQAQLSFITTITAVFLGLFSAIREVVKELPIYRHERFLNLEVGPYLWSKALPLAVLGALQVAGLLVAVHLLADVRANFLAHFVTLSVLAFAATLLGLAISCAVDSSDKAVMLMIVVIIPQFLFSNAFIKLSGFGKALGMAAIVSYWGHSAVKSLMPDDLRDLTFAGVPAEVGGFPGFPGMPAVPAGQTGLVMFGDHGWWLSFLVLLAYAALYGGLAYVALRRKDGPTGRPFAMPLLKFGAWVEVRSRVLWVLRKANDVCVALLRKVVFSLARRLGEKG